MPASVSVCATARTAPRRCATILTEASLTLGRTDATTATTFSCGLVRLTILLTRMPSTTTFCSRCRRWQDGRVLRSMFPPRYVTGRALVVVPALYPTMHFPFSAPERRNQTLVGVKTDGKRLLVKAYQLHSGKRYRPHPFSTAIPKCRFRMAPSREA